MKNYTEGFKKSLVAKITAPGGPSAYSLEEKVGISRSTLYKWIKEYGNNSSMKRKNKSPDNWSPEEKHQAVIETANMDEQELGAYLRKKGLHSTHLKQWKEEILNVLQPQKRGHKADPEKTALKKEVKTLKRELHRKDKALAEASAIIILKKKAAILFGETEEEE